MSLAQGRLTTKHPMYPVLTRVLKSVLRLNSLRDTAHNRGDYNPSVKAVVTTFTHVGKRLRESNLGTHRDCEVPLES